MELLLTAAFATAFFMSIASTKDGGPDPDEDREGSGFETAIAVDGVPEEYDYVLENCPGSHVIRQKLTSHSGKPYDVLTVMTPHGEEIEYYFDISSFFGKGF